MKNDRIFITLEDVLTSSGRYKDRAKFATPDIVNNINDLIQRVNKLLDLLGWSEKVELSSGFRVNGQGGHVIGKALDIIELKKANQKLAKLIESRPDLLKDCGLMMENKAYTIGKYTDWVHLDTLPRKPRPHQTFIPHSIVKKTDTNDPVEI